jgi:NAD(P)-dependent dehydrogenase (short-subunit alcohol dehydrogenase family)
MKYDLNQKAYVVTGATSGIGLACAAQLATHGAFVIGVGRNKERNQKAKAVIQSKSSGGNIDYLQSDLANQAQVRDLSIVVQNKLFLNGFSHLDGLVNNAGVYLGKKNMTVDGIETTFAVNHLAAFLLTHELLSLLRNAENGKVLVVSSYSHRTTPLCLERLTNPWPYLSLLAYKRSKLCNVLFTYEFNRRINDVKMFAVDPGLVNTDIASKGSRGISHWVWRNRREKGDSPEVPARTILYLLGEDTIVTSKGFYYKNCAFLKPSQKAQDEELACRLWSLSSELTNTFTWG